MCNNYWFFFICFLTAIIKSIYFSQLKSGSAEQGKLTGIVYEGMYNS